MNMDREYLNPFEHFARHPLQHYPAPDPALVGIDPFAQWIKEHPQQPAEVVGVPMWHPDYGVIGHG